MRATSVGDKLSGEEIGTDCRLLIPNMISGFRIRLTPDARAMVDSPVRKL